MQSYNYRKQNLKTKTKTNGEDGGPRKSRACRWIDIQFGETKLLSLNRMHDLLTLSFHVASGVKT